MISTGLPFDLDLFNDIKNNGALIDLSDIHFNEDNDINDIFIYLRNICSFSNLELDFSKVSKEKKFLFLKEYIITDILLNYKEFIFAWLYILIVYKKLNIEFDKVILSKLEAEEFIQINLDLVKLVYSILISSPYVLFRGIKINDDVLKSDKKIGVNFINLLSYSISELIISSKSEDDMMINYINMFDNDNIFIIMEQTIYGQFMKLFNIDIANIMPLSNIISSDISAIS